MGTVQDPLPDRVLRRFRQECFDDVQSYPEYSALTSCLAKKLGAESVGLVAGIDEAINLLARAFGRDILIFPPTYYEYFHTPRRNGITVSEQNCFDGETYRLPADANGRSLVFIANPNNPFGVAPLEGIRRLAESTDGIVAVDEAYVDFGAKTAAGLLRDFENLLILRTFSKGFCVSGARVGCIAGAKDTVAKAVERNQFFSVSSASARMALISLEEEESFTAIRANLVKRKMMFEDALRAAGYRVMDSATTTTVLKFNSTGEAASFSCSATAHMTPLG